MEEGRKDIEILLSEKAETAARLWSSGIVFNDSDPSATMAPSFAQFTITVNVDRTKDPQRIRL